MSDSDPREGDLITVTFSTSVFVISGALKLEAVVDDACDSREEDYATAARLTGTDPAAAGVGVGVA